VEAVLVGRAIPGHLPATSRRRPRRQLPRFRPAALRRRATSATDWGRSDGVPTGRCRTRSVGLAPTATTAAWRRRLGRSVWWAAGPGSALLGGRAHGAWRTGRKPGCAAL